MVVTYLLVGVYVGACLGALAVASFAVLVYVVIHRQRRTQPLPPATAREIHRDRRAHRLRVDDAR